MIYVIDIDGTLCQTPETDYSRSVPDAGAIRLVNQLYDAGHTIKVFTGRGSRSGKDWKDFTAQQLTAWGLKYHELIMGKPAGDIFIDDKAVNAKEWLANK
jgi:histidinol phosphatase-like enzyme